MKVLRWMVLVIGLAGALLGAGCGGGGGGATGPTITHLVLSLQGPINVATGSRLVIVADAVYSNGAVIRVRPGWVSAGGVGEVDAQGVFTAASQEAFGTLAATFETATASIAVNVVNPGALTDARVEAPRGVVPGAIALGAEVPFYVTADSAGNGRIYVGADPGSWMVSGGVGTIDSNTGLFTAGALGVGSVGASVGGSAATPLAIRVVQTVRVSGSVRNARTLAGIPNVTVAFLYADRTESARLTTGSDGQFQGQVPTSSTMMFVTAAPSSYFDIFRYQGVNYWVGKPATCAAAIVTPTEGRDYGSVYLFSTNDPPPPPPGCEY